jgi:streptogramin lyase
MRTKLSITVAAIALAGFLAGAPAQLSAQQAAAVAVDNDDIGGVVTGPNGPEAGVWVIAETRDLPTRYAKMVVTDDQGRFVIPDLPKANYSIWVRGYGLVDSEKVQSEPGKVVNLRAVAAPNDAAAAQYYPAIYWYSMMKVPDASHFGGKDKDIPEKITQPEWLSVLKNRSCVGCHQLGQLSTRTIPAAFKELGTGENAWRRRTQSGQAAPLMINPLAGYLGGAPYKYLGDWTDRVAKGELPHSKPTRPQGLERNVVVTTWDWGNEKQYLHDLISSDRRNPTVNANGPLIGSPEYATDTLPILDPKTNKVSYFKAPVRDKTMPESLGPGHAAVEKPVAASAYWGEEKLWDSKVNNHNSMYDAKGRVWLAAAIRGPDNPAFCKKGSDHPSAKVLPIEKNVRQVAIFEPKTQKYTFVDTCFGSHHLQFDKNDVLWTSGAGPMAGWIDTKTFDETGDAAKSQGWSPFVLDLNGNGKRDEYTEPNAPADANKDMRITGGSGTYAVMPNPADGSVWYTVGVFAGKGGVIRFDPKTQLSEVYNVPTPGFGPRGGDIDSKGVVWVSLASGHIGSFDRSKCKAPLNGPKATGDHCPEGWAFYKYPGPGFEGIGDNSAEASYYSWVDQHNTLGLGNDVPISTANLQDGFAALKDGKMVLLRVPYPLGFYAKGLDGRIDDPNAGWKGRGLWSSSGDRTPWLIEGGKGRTPMAVHIQVRPDPLAH